MSIRKRLVVCFLMIPTVHIILILWARYEFKRALYTGQPVKIGLLKHAGGNRVEVLGFIGDAFNPHKYNATIQYDLVPVSCVIDPIYILENKIVWESNFT